MRLENRDWLPGVEERLGFYVYLLIDPRTQDVFYVGKGTGGRCFDHVAEALGSSHDDPGDYEKLGVIRDIESETQVEIDILRHDLTEEEAFYVESLAIDIIGVGSLANRVRGHGAGRSTVDDVNAVLGARPVELDGSENLLLIRVTNRFFRGISDADLYEATRRWWRVGSRRERATHALAVNDGVVRGIYRIDGWEPVPNDLVEEDSSRHGRWGFWGETDPAMADKWMLTDVTAQFSQGNQNPITYLGCD